MSNEEIRRAILEMDEREELAKDMLEQVNKSSQWRSSTAHHTLVFKQSEKKNCENLNGLEEKEGFIVVCFEVKSK